MDRPTPENRVLRDAEVRARTGLSRVQRWRLVRSGKFPAPVQLSPNAIGWMEDAINTWLADRPTVDWAPQRNAEDGQ